MPTITRKIQLHLCKEGLSDDEREAQRKLLLHINDNTTVPLKWTYCSLKSLK